MDIKSFFTSIDQRILYNLVAKKVKKKEILWLAQTIIFHDCARDIPPKIQSQPSLFAKLPSDKSLFTAPKGKGLPIGNLTSQFFANVYLNELDQFVKRKLRAKYYLRYVDDFLIIDADKEKLEEYKKQISQFVKDTLGLTVHPQKQIVRPIEDGIDFVGYVVRPEYVLIRKRVVGEWRWKMRKIKNIKKRQEAFSAYTAHAKWANARHLQKKMAERLVLGSN